MLTWLVTRPVVTDLYWRWYVDGMPKIDAVHPSKFAKTADVMLLPICQANLKALCTPKNFVVALMKLKIGPSAMGWPYLPNWLGSP